jgi:hypothetical protein
VRGREWSAERLVRVRVGVRVRARARLGLGLGFWFGLEEGSGLEGT